MAQVSKRKLDPRILQKVFDLFLDSLTSTGNRKQTKEFLDELLTPTEKIMLAKRIAIAYLVLQGLDQRSIANFLKVSTSTVAKISLLLKIQGDGLPKVLGRLLRRKKIANVLDSIAEILLDSTPPVSYSKRKEWRKNKLQRKIERSSLL
jgi:uncharacterized protein YerC